tara:strand:+ start:158 stop:1369 length:1212 start_codon:yes stop_codon:yes gene_type:complete
MSKVGKIGRVLRRPYRNISLSNTTKAYSLLDDKKLIRQQQLYKLFNLFSKNEKIGQKAITTFMNTKPPIIYPKIQDTLFDQFCGGESLDEMTPLVKKLMNKNVMPLFNYGVEYSTKEEDLEKCKDEMLDMITYLNTNKDGKKKGYSIIRVTGVMSHKRLEMFQNKTSFIKKDAELWERDKKRLEQVCELAVSKKVKLLFDAETYNIQTAIHQLSLQMMRRFNGLHPRIYGTIQFYRKDSHDQLKNLIEDGIENHYLPGLKLVRGAYIHDEMLAGTRGIIHDTKENTDKSYNTAVTKCIKNLDNIAVCFAGHNTETVLHILEELDKYEIEAMHPHIILAQMYGMRNDITFNLEDVNVAQFIPYGKKEFLFPYLVRRGIENSSALGGSQQEVDLVTREIIKRKIN